MEEEELIDKRAMCYLHPVKHACVDVGGAYNSSLDEVRTALRNVSEWIHFD